jgi:hypothetical protein
LLNPENCKWMRYAQIEISPVKTRQIEP